MLMAMLLLAATSGGCTPGGEYEPRLCPAGLPPIAQVTVERTAIQAYVDPTRSETCAGFRPTAAQVRHFLETAGTTDPESADATIDRSPCQATGTVRFQTGEVARWMIERMGFALLDREGREPQILFCAHCLAAPSKVRKQL